MMVVMMTASGCRALFLCQALPSAPYIYFNPFKPHDLPRRSVLLLSQFTDKETKSQKLKLLKVI